MSRVSLHARSIRLASNYRVHLPRHSTQALPKQKIATNTSHEPGIRFSLAQKMTVFQAILTGAGLIRFQKVAQGLNASSSPAVRFTNPSGSQVSLWHFSFRDGVSDWLS